jgi:CheY-like chemotaxis protein
MSQIMARSQGSLETKIFMKTILVADDNPNDLKYVVKVIGAIEKKCQVITAKNGLEALSKWRELRDQNTPINLMLIDNHMGDFSGFDTIEYIRKEGYTGPTFILTGDVNVKNTRPENITDILYKPLNRHHIIDALMTIPPKQLPNDNALKIHELDSLITKLDRQIEGKDEFSSDLETKKCNVHCSFVQIGTSTDREKAIIVNLSKKNICIYTEKVLYKNAKLSITSPAPLNLDLDVWISEFRRQQNGFVYCCAFLLIRRALI